MLSLLKVNNLLLIENAEVEFKTGLNTVTGETGAGKSILLDCLSFVLGWNNRSDLLRKADEPGEVVAEFSVPSNHITLEILLEADIPVGKPLIIIRRTISDRGRRKRIYVNDRVVSLEFLKTISSHLVEMQGQKDSHALLKEKNHRDFLDQFALLEDDVLEASKIWKKIQLMKQELIDREFSAAESKVEEKHLERSISEIEELSFEDGEEIELDSKRKFLRAAFKNKERIGRANQILNSGDLENNIADAIRWLVETRDSLGHLVERTSDALERTLTDLNEAQREMNDLSRSLDFDEAELERVEERLFKIRSLSRKHNVTSDLLSKIVLQFKEELARRVDNEEQTEKLKSDLLKIEEQFSIVANEISVKRAEAIKTLDMLVNQELKYLKMGDCIFKTELTQVSANSSGIDHVKFMVITNKGGQWGEVGRISSGGELSRFLLALKVCLSKKEQGTALVFDEIDRGIGGATADSVGKRLLALSELDQIIVVTHSPQVASHGSNHWLVKKDQNEINETFSTVRELNYEDRLNEIARMISGETVSKEARAAAKNLLPQSHN